MNHATGRYGRASVQTVPLLFALFVLVAGLIAAPPAARAQTAQTAQTAQSTQAAQAASGEKPVWAWMASDITPDPSVRYGVLANGMRYALMKNQLPPGAVSIRFDLKFGSLDEADSEQGLAHVIEHMAFNGSRHVAEGEMVKILERLGLAFGADTNAQTGQEHTTYRFDLPKADDKLVDEGLFLTREIASELLFDPSAIDREKGVVLSEERRGDNFQRRRAQQQLDFLLPGAYAPTRMPIGKVAVIEGASHDQLQSLYDRYYRPERATLVIVGDIDVDAMESKIKATFGDWAGRGEPGREPDLHYTPTQRPSAASVFTRADGGDFDRRLLRQTLRRPAGHRREPARSEPARRRDRRAQPPHVAPRQR